MMLRFSTRSWRSTVSSNANDWTHFARSEDYQGTRRLMCRGLWRIPALSGWGCRKHVASWRRGAFAVSGIGHLYYWVTERCPRGRTTRRCCTPPRGTWGSCALRWTVTGGARTGLLRWTPGELPPRFERPGGIRDGSVATPRAPTDWLGFCQAPARCPCAGW